MNILRVIATMDPSSGGPCQGIRNSIPTLNEFGVYNEVICMDDPNSEFLEKDTFPIYAFGPANNPWAYTRKLIPWLNENISRFEVVIVHGLWQYPGYAVNQALKHHKGKNPKLLVMPHGMLDPYFQKASDRKLKAMRNWFYWKLIEQKLIHRAQGILFTCEQELLLARDTFRPYRPAKEINVGYGIPKPPAFTPQMSAEFLRICPKIKDKPYLLFLSRIHKKKGVDLLLKAYSQIIGADMQDELPLLVIAGPGMDTGYGRQLQQMVNRNAKLKEAVFFPGMLTGDVKWGAFYGSEAFLLPSHQENFGIAIVEALACGKPVLISDQVNIWREISDSGAGIITKDNLMGVNKLLKGWSKLPKNQKIIMGKRAENCFQNHFSIQQASKKMINSLLESLNLSNNEKEENFIQGSPK